MQVKALLFDVFGTCVDWFGSVSREIQRHAADIGCATDVAAMTLAWRQAYFDGMAEVRAGREPWRKVDDIHREALDRLLDEYGMDALDESARLRLNRVWHHLQPWPDTRQGLHALRQDHYIATLSNGNLELLIDLARFGELPWDMLFCSDLFKAFKPDTRTYLGACDMLDLQTQEVMMVACHRGDLQAAADCGLQTGFVHRAAEFGHHRVADVAQPGEFTRVAHDFNDLAEQLEAAA
jgi:2-haloacid dehalogenase